MHSNIIGNRTVEVKSISIPATHMSQNFWCHFCEAWIMHFCLWDHKRREDRCKCIKASTRLKWWRFSSATARLLIQQGWCWKQVTVGTKSSERRCKVEVTVHHRLLSICMRSCRRGGGGVVSDWRWLGGWNDRLFKLSVPQTYCRSTAGR